MIKSVQLKITAFQLEQLHTCLFLGDGMEYVAIVLCGRCSGDKEKLLVHEIHPVPHDAYLERSDISVQWKTEFMVPLLERAQSEHMAILKVHSHPSGYENFSEIDDESDRKLFPSVHGWTDDGMPHASAIMLPDRRLIARAWHDDGNAHPVERITIIGDNIEFIQQCSETKTPEFARRHAQVFGKKTTSLLKNLSIAVVGCSGTGSLVIEQLARLGIGKLILVDHDRVEEKNLNRIVNATRQDADNGTLKVDVLERAIRAMDLGCEVVKFPVNIWESQQALEAIAGCDAVFGCTDGAEGRFLLNKLASFYLLPYIDLGVRIDADGAGGVDQVCCSVHYLQPGKSSLLSRKMITNEQVTAEGMKRTNPVEYGQQLKDGYIHGVREDRPAVISINMLAASLAVNELLARLHPYRNEDNVKFSKISVSLTEGEIYPEEEQWPCSVLSKYVGRGDMVTFMGMPALSLSNKS